VRNFAKVVRGPIPQTQKAITLRTAITMSAGIEGPCVQFVFLGLRRKCFCLEVVQKSFFCSETSLIVFLRTEILTLIYAAKKQKSKFW
jgi:hypothetical protein